MRRLIPIVCGCVLAAGCGSERAAAPQQPKLPRQLAQRLARESDAVSAALARGDACRAASLAARLRGDATASIGQVPPRLQEPLSSGVNAVVARIPACTPPAAPPQARPHDKGKHKGRDKHGKGGDD